MVVVMNAHLTKVVAKATFHEDARGGIQGLTW